MMTHSTSIKQDTQISISRREVQILNLIVDEFTNKEIATKLFISSQTVASHRKNMREKLSVRNTAGLVRKSFELGLLTMS